MPNVEEARVSVTSAHNSAQQGHSTLTSAHSSLEDAQNGLRYGAEGSNEPESGGQLLVTEDNVDVARQQVASAPREFEGVALRLRRGSTDTEAAWHGHS